MQAAPAETPLLAVKEQNNIPQLTQKGTLILQGRDWSKHRVREDKGGGTSPTLYHTHAQPPAANAQLLKHLITPPCMLQHCTLPTT